MVAGAPGAARHRCRRRRRLTPGRRVRRRGSQDGGLLSMTGAHRAPPGRHRHGHRHVVGEGAGHWVRAPDIVVGTGTVTSVSGVSTPPVSHSAHSSVSCPGSRSGDPAALVCQIPCNTTRCGVGWPVHPRAPDRTGPADLNPVPRCPLRALSRPSLCRRTLDSSCRTRRHFATIGVTVPTKPVNPVGRGGRQHAAVAACEWSARTASAC